MGLVSSAVTILKRLQQEGVPEVQKINLKVMMMANVAAFQETLPAVLSSTYEIVSRWMEDHKPRLGKEKYFWQLYCLSMKAKGCVDWFKTTIDGEAILSTA